MNIDYKLSKYFHKSKNSRSNAQKKMHDKKIKYYSKLMLVGGNNTFKKVIFSPNNNQVAAINKSNKVIIIDNNTNASARTLEDPEESVIEQIMYFSNGFEIITQDKIIIDNEYDPLSGEDRNIVQYNLKFWNSQNGTLIRKKDFIGGDTFRIIFSPDRTKFIVITKSMHNNSNNCTLYDSNTMNKINDIATIRDAKYRNIIRNITYSPDSSQVAVIIKRSSNLHGDFHLENDSYSAAIYSTETGTIIRQLSEMSDDIISAVYSPNNQQIAVISSKNNVTLYNSRSGQKINSHMMQGDISSVVFSPDNSQITIVGANSLKIWDSTIKIFDDQLGTQINQFDNVSSMFAYSPNGDQMAIVFPKDQHSENQLNNIRIWNSSTFELIREFDIPSSNQVRMYNTVEIKYSPKEEYFVAISSNIAKIWNVLSGQLVREYTHGINNITFSLDNKLIAVYKPEGCFIEPLSQ
jgi:WD domain, G-beta repeat